jgi:hypothetical protein
MNFLVGCEHNPLFKLAYFKRNAELFSIAGPWRFPLQKRRAAFAYQHSTRGFMPVNRCSQQAVCHFERKAAQDFS